MTGPTPSLVVAGPSGLAIHSRPADRCRLLGSPLDEWRLRPLGGPCDSYLSVYDMGGDLPVLVLFSVTDQADEFRRLWLPSALAVIPHLAIELPLVSDSRRQDAVFTVTRALAGAAVHSSLAMLPQSRVDRAVWAAMARVVTRVLTPHVEPAPAATAA